MARLSAHARTDRGLVRGSNEDAFVCRTSTGVFAVIDGMGGQEAGEIAAAIAAEALAQVPATPGLVGEAVLVQALRDARARILAHAGAHPDTRGLGAVATAARMDDDGRAVSIAHLGDARAWRVSARGVQQLTEDHALDASEGGSRRGAVTRDLGREDLPDDAVATYRAPLDPGDLLVLATDGLHGAVPPRVLDATLREIHAQPVSPAAACKRLVRLALANGGPDNVSVVVLRGGRWRRRSRARRLGQVLTWGLFAALVALTVMAGWRRLDTPRGQLPAEVTGTVELSRDTTRVGEVHVEPGSRLVLRGTEIVGGGTVVVDEGGELHIVRSVVTARAPLDVRLSRDATLVLEDVRIEAPVQVRGTTVSGGGVAEEGGPSSARSTEMPASGTGTRGSRVVIRHALLARADLVAVEGVASVDRSDVQVSTATVSEDARRP